MKILETTGNNGIKTYSTVDEDRGVPYCTVFVNESGDYWTAVYGALSFTRSDHARIIEEIKPTGKDITAKVFYKK